MRILSIDIDSLRPDHLGCYGYHRNTSPNIDAVARRGVRCENHYVADAPCGPSRSGFFSARFGIHSGAMDHGGLHADVYPQGWDRGMRRGGAHAPWLRALREQGYRTVMISPFAERHSQFHVHDGFNETYNTGGRGQETADEVIPTVLDWFDRNGHENQWFMHFNVWDPHTYYRTPDSYGNPFADEPIDEWLTEEMIQAFRASYGPNSAREPNGYSPRPAPTLRQPVEIRDRKDLKTWIDGYDVAIRYVDDHLGQVFDALSEKGVLDDTLIIISSDHGENQGELNIFGDHQTADYVTGRIPLIVAGPGVKPGHVDRGFHYQIDVGPTLVELVGGEQNPGWDGRSFVPALTEGATCGRPSLVLSQMTWTCQRGVRFGPWMYVRTYEPGLKAMPTHMLFDVEQDPHEVTNLAERRPEVVGEALRLLDAWYEDVMRTAPGGHDPMWSIVQHGGGYHTRTHLDLYCRRLEDSGRAHHAAYLRRVSGRSMSGG